MGKTKLTPEEAAERQRERCRKYWAEHREEIALKRKAKRKKDKAERKAKEQANRKRAALFLETVSAESAAMDFMRSVLDGGDPVKLIEAWEKHRNEITGRA